MKVNLKSIVILIFVFLLTNYEVLSQKGGDDWLSTIVCEPTSTEAIINCNERILNGCNYIVNNTFTPNSLYDNSITHYQNPFNYQPSLIPEWVASHGSPNIFDGVNFPSSLPFSNSGYARMGAWAEFGESFSEGIIQKIPKLTQGNSYAFSFFKKLETIASQPGLLIDNFKIVLMHCSDFGQLYRTDYRIPRLPVNSQVIFCERQMTNIDWEQVFFKFVADQDYDMIWIYPEQSSLNSGSPAILLFSYPELIDVDNFSVGQTSSGSNCNISIGPSPLNCFVRNSQFTWTDPNGNIIYQGPNQIYNLNMASDPPGNYTLSMSVPGIITLPNNLCSQNNPVFNASVTVSLPCNCGLQIGSPTIGYYGSSANTWVNQNLNTCNENNLCYNINEYMEFNGISSSSTGNTWEVFITDYYNPNGGPFNYWSDNGSTNPVSNATNTTISFVLDPLAYAVVEIRLTNTLLNQIKSVFFRINPMSAVGYICYSNSNAGYKKMMGFPDNVPGNSYSWTFPAGISLINPNVLQVEYSDVGYSGTYPTNANLQVMNSFGCPSYSQTVPIVFNPPINCSAKLPSGFEKRPLNSIISNRIKPSKIYLFPNPAKDVIIIKSSDKIKEIAIQNIDGRVIKIIKPGKFTSEINISGLSAGIYFVLLTNDDGAKAVHKMIKQ